MSALPFPRISSLSGRTLALLIERGSDGITHRALDVIARSYRLSGYIYAIRGMGWPIETELFMANVKADGMRPVNIARYSLAPEVWELIEPAEAFEFVARVRDWEKGRKGMSQAPGASTKARDGHPGGCAGCPFGQYSKAEVKA